MGSPVSAMLANLGMEYVEEKALELRYRKLKE